MRSSAVIKQLAITDFPAVQQDKPELHVWDVRDSKSFAEGHIVGAVNRPIEHLDASTLAGIPQGEPVYVLCGGGTKAGRAVTILEALDPTRDYVELKGGTRGAKAAGWPIVSEA
ncbi:rhodanese-like domain-containing protein [Aquirhabdus parva]|uniref:Rhodanese-like domain-containing protein n=1 Tax=Aquirhabdus parva TaxID=2283318 RepID=A0A345PBM4_9GAMM|nr:rhodanese-like domain-containing protein [Aquirhabdus parva]